MKIKRDYPHQEFSSIQSAIEDKLTPSPYSYEGQLEYLNECIRIQRAFTAILVERLTNSGKLDKSDIAELLGYSYTVED